MAGVLSNLALIESEQHAYQKAEIAYSRALAIEEKTVGPDHPEVAAMLNNLAQIYRFESAIRTPKRHISGRSASGSSP